MTTPIFTMSAEVKALLPDVLIDYLCNLALSEEYNTRPVQTFALDPAELGGRLIQHVLHGGTLRRVFGFDPISCTLCVLHNTNHYQMVVLS